MDFKKAYPFILIYTYKMFSFLVGFIGEYKLLAISSIGMGILGNAVTTGSIYS